MCRFKACRFHPLNSRIYNWMEPVVKTQMQMVSSILKTLCFMNSNAPRGQVYSCVRGGAEIIAE